MNFFFKKTRFFYLVGSAILFVVWLFIPPCRSVVFLIWKVITLLLMIALAEYLWVLASKRSRINKNKEQLKKIMKIKGGNSR